MHAMGMTNGYGKCVCRIDEYIFIVDLIKAGGKAIFLPLRIATHPADSSGSRWGEKQDRIARAIVFTRVLAS